ncbi:MAG: rod shape-determining protein MreC [Alistipes sp.]|nr:rod shape-determining protein MreC [Alistipes sp.]
MHKLLYFIRKTYVAIIFVILEIIAIRSYAYSTPYTQARLLKASHSVVRGMHSAIQGVGEYFSLRRQNIMLTERIAELENRLDAIESANPDIEFEVTAMHRYDYIAARVVSNSINRPQNFITIDKGLNDGVKLNMAVLSPEGYAVGSIVNCSENFSIAKSLLNNTFKVGGRLSEDGSIGTLHWNGGDAQMAIFDEVSKYANINEGDMVVASGFSYYFPPEVIIGTIESVEFPENRTTYDCRVRLAADFSRLSNVILVSNNMADEAQSLDSTPKH